MKLTAQQTALRWVSTLKASHILQVALAMSLLAGYIVYQHVTSTPQGILHRDPHASGASSRPAPRGKPLTNEPLTTFTLRTRGADTNTSQPRSRTPRVDVAQQRAHVGHVAKEHELEAVEGSAADRGKVILLWKPLFGKEDFNLGSVGRTPFLAHKCAVTSCYISSSRRDLRAASAVVVNARELVRGFPEVLRKHKRRRHSVNVFFMRESPLHLKPTWRDQGEIFNVTMTYRYDSDVPAPIFSVYRLPINHAKVKPYRLTFPFAQRSRLVAWVVSNCRKGDTLRREYITRLRRYLDIDIYGRCGNNTLPRHDTGVFTSFIPSRYKFYLGFENSVCRDYVTEKLFRTLTTEVVPVVFGGTDYARDAPPHSVINAREYTPYQLANYLRHLAANETAYMEYFAWKGHYRVRGGLPSGFCQLCALLNDPAFTAKPYPDIYQWWTKDQCAAPANVSNRVIRV